MMLRFAASAQMEALCASSSDMLLDPQLNILML